MGLLENVKTAVSAEKFTMRKFTFLAMKVFIKPIVCRMLVWNGS